MTPPIAVDANVTLEAALKCAMAPGLHAVEKGAEPEADQLDDVQVAAGPVGFQNRLVWAGRTAVAEPAKAPEQRATKRKKSRVRGRRFTPAREHAS